MGFVLIFDYDGVIADSLSIFMKSFLDACKIEGWGSVDSKEKFLHLFDGNMYENMKNMGMTMDEIRAIVHRVRDYLIEHHQDIDMFPGMKDSLSYLVKNHPLLIATSNDSAVVEGFLQFNGSDIFDDIYGSDKGPSKVKKLITIKQMYPTDDCVYIGDTVGDIIEGKQAGVITVAVSWGWHDEKKLEQAHPDHLIHFTEDLKLLPKVIHESMW
jgi:phosphoglycolate phosphatase